MASKLIGVHSNNLDVVVDDDDDDDNDNNNNNNNNNVSKAECIQNASDCFLMRLLTSSSIAEVQEFASLCLKLAADTGSLPPFDDSNPNDDRETCNEEFAYIIQQGDRGKLLCFILFCIWLVDEVRLVFCPNKKGGKFLTNPAVLNDLCNGYMLPQADGSRKQFTPLDTYCAIFLTSASPGKNVYESFVENVYSEIVALQSWKDMEYYSNVEADQPSQQIMQYVNQQEKFLASKKEVEKEQEQKLMLEFGKYHRSATARGVISSAEAAGGGGGGGEAGADKNKIKRIKFTEGDK